MTRWYTAGSAEKGANGCIYYRQTLPFRHCAKFLQERGVEVTQGGPPTLDFDAYFFTRFLAFQYLPLLIEIKRLGKRIIWDLDDDIRTLPRRATVGNEFIDQQLNCLNICLAMA